MSAIAERVAAGAAFLDEREPGWDQRIDLGRLNLKSECRCVLGQLNSALASDWGVITGKYGLHRAWDSGPRGLADTDLGFNVSVQRRGDEAEWAELTAAWHQLITARRAVS